MSLKDTLARARSVPVGREYRDYMDNDPEWRKVLALYLYLGHSYTSILAELQENHGYRQISDTAICRYVKKHGRDVLTAEGKALVEELEGDAG